jgi:hypothetical protein
LCTLATAPQDQRGTDEPGHHQVKDREVDIPGPGENEDGQPGEVERLWREPGQVRGGGSTTKPSREGNAVECGLIVIPTAGQRDPTSVE